MFLSPFDPGYDFEPPSGSALLAEIGIDPHTVSEVIDDDRAIRCPDRDSVLPEPSRFAHQASRAMPSRARSLAERS